MRMKIKAAILALIFVGSATAAMAQRDGRDAADRGTRLDLGRVAKRHLAATPESTATSPVGHSGTWSRHR